MTTKFLKHTLLILFVFFTKDIYSQTSKEIIQRIDSLSWESLTYMENKILKFSRDSPAWRLIKTGEKAIPHLMSHIKDSEKTVAIHFILMYIIQSSSLDLMSAIDSLPIYENCDKLVGYHNIYMGFNWEYFFEKGYSLSTYELNSFEEYWNIILSGGTINLLSADHYIENLKKKDKIQYPCGYTNENNSESLKLKKLVKTIGQKEDSKLIRDVFKALGKDSIIETFYPVPHLQEDTIKYVTFPFDGIKFIFKNKELANIDIKARYIGALPYEIKFSEDSGEYRKKIREEDFLDEERLSFDYKNVRFIPYWIYDEENEVSKMKSILLMASDWKMKSSSK